MKTVTFWKSDFVGENLEQLIEILKQYAISGTGCWFRTYGNFIEAGFEDYGAYDWIMENVANYGNLNINK